MFTGVGAALLCALLVASACGGRASEAERRAARGEFPQQEVQRNATAEALPASASETVVGTDSGTGAATSAVGSASSSTPTATPRNLQTPTTQAVLDGMWSYKDETLGGLVQPLTFTKGQNAPRLACWWPLVLTGGKWTAPSGVDVKCC